jgi:myo-inositol-1(or 4)-monophosphatase
MEELEIKNNPDFSEIKNLVLQMWVIARQNAFANLKISKKTQDELVTELDVELEQMARNKIKKIFGQVDFLWEEFGEQINRNSKYKFIIDPIDWTESYINKEFNSSISIWIENIKNKKIEFWAVYDFMKDILYLNEKWKNTIYFNWNEIEFPKIESNKIKILVSWEKKQVDDIINNLNANNSNLRLSRQYGSLALQISQVSAWMYDIFIRPNKIKTWDIVWAIPQAKTNNNIKIKDYKWNNFDYNNPENWLIIYKKEYRKIIEKLINNF